MRKSSALLIICIILTLILSGCKSSRELDDLSIMIGMGIDKAETPGNVLLTAQIVKPGEIKQASTPSGGGKAGTTNPYWNIKSSGPTVFDAVRDFTHITGKKLYISHNEVFIFGSDLAAEGVEKHLDFFLRARETRPTNLILVSAGRAGEVLNVKPEAEKFPAVNIRNLVKASSFTGHFKMVNLQEFTARLMSNTTAPVAPLIGIVDQGDEQAVYVSGMAVFKGDKMIGSLSPIESRGLLWVLNEVKSGVIDVDSPDGNGKVSLEITSVTGKMSAQIKDGNITMQVKIMEEANITNVTGTIDLTKIPVIELLQKSEADVIRNEILGAFEKAKVLDADFFGFGDKIHEQYPGEWKQLENSWDEIFPGIEVETEIECKIRRTGLITKPAIPAKEE